MTLHRPDTLRELCALGADLREQRVARGISVPELASRAGVPVQAVYDVEHGDRHVAWSAYIALRQALTFDQDAIPTWPAPIEDRK